MVTALLTTLLVLAAPAPFYRPVEIKPGLYDMTWAGGDYVAYMSQGGNFKLQNKHVHGGWADVPHYYGTWSWCAKTRNLLIDEYYDNRPVGKWSVNLDEHGHGYTESINGGCHGVRVTVTKQN